MSIRKKFEDEIAKLTEIIERSTAERETWQKALRLLPREGATPNGSSRGFRPGSEMERAQNALKVAGKAMHIGAIVVAIGKEDSKDNRTNLQSQLNAHAKNGNVFTRPAPGTYGLIEFPTQQEELADILG